MICQWSCTDMEKCLPCGEYWVTLEGQFWNLMSIKKGVTGVVESFGDVSSDDF